MVFVVFLLVGSVIGWDAKPYASMQECRDAIEDRQQFVGVIPNDTSVWDITLDCRYEKDMPK